MLLPQDSSSSSKGEGQLVLKPGQQWVNANYWQQLLTVRAGWSHHWCVLITSLVPSVSLASCSGLGGLLRALCVTAQSLQGTATGALLSLVAKTAQPDSPSWNQNVQEFPRDLSPLRIMSKVLAEEPDPCNCLGKAGTALCAQ